MRITLHAVDVHQLLALFRPMCDSHDGCRWITSQRVFHHSRKCPRSWYNRTIVNPPPKKTRKPRSKQRGKSEKPPTIIHNKNTPPSWDFSQDNIHPDTLRKYE